MAPTETLAEQHFLTIEGICARARRHAARSSTGSIKSNGSAAQADVVVGTHALIQEGFEFRDLAVAVVDEQHRFGVEQRSALAEGRSPHVLHMTATPIPRTLALTVYGDLAVSEIAKPPAIAQADRHGLGDRRAQLRGVHAPARAPRGGPAGLRRLPADRGVGDARPRGRPSRRPSGCAPAS